MTTVIHCKKDIPTSKERYVYIGRPGIWGNPFTIQKHGRDGAIAEYRKWILRQPDLIKLLPMLKDKTLGCWCKPEACHGDVLAELADMPFHELIYESAVAILDEFIQIENVPKHVVDAYHHGIRGKLGSQSAEIYLLKADIKKLEAKVQYWGDKHKRDVQDLENEVDNLQEQLESWES